MPSTTTPISNPRFAAALTDLPISSLHAKIAELQNSISHLERSNKDLEDFARGGDKDCYEALLENRGVISKFEERVVLVRREIVEVRGLPLEPREGERAVVTENGAVGNHGDERSVNGGRDVDMEGTENERPAQRSGASDSQQNGTAGDDHGEEGVFL